MNDLTPNPSPARRGEMGAGHIKNHLGSLGRKALMAAVYLQQKFLRKFRNISCG
jgi:hypothetical protein